MTHKINDQYAAAWIEARGQVQTNDGGVGRQRPQVRVTAIDPAVPEALCEFYGLGKVDTFNPRTNPRLTLHVWQVRGRGALDVLECTVPYMVSDIRRDVEYILERTLPGQSYDGDVLFKISVFFNMQTAHSAIVEAQETPPADINACHTAKTWVHEYYKKSWAGKCEGYRLTPLSLRICPIPGSAGSRVQTINTRGCPSPL